MSEYKVYTELNTEVKRALEVKGFLKETGNVAEFIASHGERFHYDEKRKRYFINSFYPSFPGKAWERFIHGCIKITKDEKRVPVQADIVVTGKCHCSCWHCFRIKDKREDLKLEEIKRCFEELHQLGTATIGITGGEPMLRCDIKEIISMIPDGIEGQLYTTGHKIDDSFAKFIHNSKITRAIISLDHYDNDVACKMRNYKSAFSEAVDAIKILVNNGIYTAVTVCITDKLMKEDELKKYFDFVSSLGPDEIRVIMPIPQGNLEGRDVGRIYSEAVKFVKRQKQIYEKIFLTLV